MNEVNLSIFKFDYDNTWMSLFLDANDQVYSRYGGRDASDPEGRLSVNGIKYSMRLVLQEHKNRKTEPVPATHKPTLPRDLFEVKGKGCMHCHQVWEGLRKQERALKRFDPESLYVYPLPENIGLQLDADAGNKAVGVKRDSPGQRAGMRTGDVIERIDQVKIFSQGDVMWALHNAPAEGN